MPSSWLWEEPVRSFYASCTKKEKRQIDTALTTFEGAVDRGPVPPGFDLTPVAHLPEGDVAEIRCLSQAVRAVFVRCRNGERRWVLMYRKRGTADQRRQFKRAEGLGRHACK